jgi:CheY-like chemotaxis protein
MDSNTLTRIFEPFFTTKDATKGTGLGLATVYGFVKQSGGYITVDSKLGRGTTFRIFLPLTESPVLAIKAPEPEHAPVAGRETILVVEDEVALREAIAHLLRERGYHVLEAASGQEALAIVSTFVNQIDVLLTDVVMPAMSGPEVARAITAVRPCIKTLFMSGHAEPTLRQYCAPGEVSLLQKPFTSDVLGRAIAALLRGESAAAEQADAGPTRIGPREASTSPPQDERANNAS